LKLIFLIIVVLLLVASRALWGDKRTLGHRPSRGLGVVLLVLLVWVLLNYIPRGFSR
jgi:hypothetical protein